MGISDLTPIWNNFSSARDLKTVLGADKAEAIIPTNLKNLVAVTDLAVSPPMFNLVAKYLPKSSSNSDLNEIKISFHDAKSPQDADITKFYDIEGTIGRGGEGTVYRAKRKSDAKAVAIKQSINYDGGIQNIFRRARHKFIKSMLSHGIPMPRAIYTNMKPFSESFAYNKATFYEMDLCDGKDLDRILTTNRYKIDIDKTFIVLDRVLDALNLMHSKEFSIRNRNQSGEIVSEQKFNMLYKDLKPENIIVPYGTNGEFDYTQTRLIDFGSIDPVDTKLKQAEQQGVTFHTASPTRMDLNIYHEQEYRNIPRLKASTSTDIYEALMVFFKLNGLARQQPIPDLNFAYEQFINDKFLPKRKQALKLASVAKLNGVRQFLLSKVNDNERLASNINISLDNFEKQIGDYIDAYPSLLAGRICYEPGKIKAKDNAIEQIKATYKSLSKELNNSELDSVLITNLNDLVALLQNDHTFALSCLLQQIYIILQNEFIDNDNSSCLAAYNHLNVKFFEENLKGENLIKHYEKRHQAMIESLMQLMTDKYKISAEKISELKDSLTVLLSFRDINEAEQAKALQNLRKVTKSIMSEDFKLNHLKANLTSSANSVSRLTQAGYSKQHAGEIINTSIDNLSQIHKYYQEIINDRLYLLKNILNDHDFKALTKEVNALRKSGKAEDLIALEVNAKYKVISMAAKLDDNKDLIYYAYSLAPDFTKIVSDANGVHSLKLNWQKILMNLPKANNITGDSKNNFFVENVHIENFNEVYSRLHFISNLTRLSKYSNLDDEQKTVIEKAMTELSSSNTFGMKRIKESKIDQYIKHFIDVYEQDAIINNDYKKMLELTKLIYPSSEELNEAINSNQAVRDLFDEDLHHRIINDLMGERGIKEKLGPEFKQVKNNLTAMAILAKGSHTC